MAPGHRADSQALLPEVHRARERFGPAQVCRVTDGGMASEAVLAELDALVPRHTLGARLWAVRQVREAVVSHPGRYRKVDAHLYVNEVWAEDRHYVVAYNPQEAARQRASRQGMLQTLAQKLAHNPKALVANRGFRRFLKVARGSLAIDPVKAQGAARYDEKCFIRTNTDLQVAEVAFQYKQLWQVEAFFRAAKSLIDSRSIYHPWDATITGHLFVSFVERLLAHELHQRLEAKGLALEWAGIL